MSTGAAVPGAAVAGVAVAAGVAAAGAGDMLCLLHINIVAHVYIV